MQKDLIVQATSGIRKAFGYRFPRLGQHAMNAFFSMMPGKFDALLFPGIWAELHKSDLTQRSTYWQGTRFESPTAQILQSWINSDTTHFFDIGSNYGFFSYWMLSQESMLKVHSFEPNPATFDIVQKIKVRNSLDRLYPWNMGLGDVSAKLSLHPGTEDSGHSTFGNHPELHSLPIADIRVLPFTKWLTEAGIVMPTRPSWIAKIDVEGFELKVLQGMEPVLRSRAFQGIAIEVNEFTLKFCNAKPQEVLGFLESCGYRQVFSSKCGNVFFIPA